MLKKKFLLIVVFIVFLFIIFFQAMVQRPLVEKESFEVHSVRYHGKIIKNIDIDELKEIICNYKKRRTLKSFSPYLEDDVFIEIGIINEGKPLHILLGKFYVCYESAGKGFWIIEGGEELLREILFLINESEKVIHVNTCEEFNYMEGEIL